MAAYKTEFIELALEIGVLKFGQFKLKSGRVSPYFYNSGLFSTGYAAAKLGRYYAAAADASGIAFDMIFSRLVDGCVALSLLHIGTSAEICTELRITEPATATVGCLRIADGIVGGVQISGLPSAGFVRPHAIAAKPVPVIIVPRVHHHSDLVHATGACPGGCGLNKTIG